MSSGEDQVVENGPDSPVADTDAGETAAAMAAAARLVTGADPGRRAGPSGRLRIALMVIAAGAALYLIVAALGPTRPVIMTGLQAGDIYGPATPAVVPAWPPAPRELTLRLARRSTLIETLTRAGVPTGDAYGALAALGRHIDPRRLAIGQEMTVVLESVPAGKTYTLPVAGRAPGPVEYKWVEQLSSLTLRSAFDKYLVTTRAADADGGSGGFVTEQRTIPTLTLTRYGAGVIEDSLYLSAERAGLPQEIIIEMIRIFSFNVDFQREIRQGDGFEVYFERRATTDRLELEEGGILYASMRLRGKPMTFYRFNTGGQGDWDYFDAEGKSARRTLMKTPIDGARLTSRYGRRKHPVLGFMRNHQGVDFSTGRSGTPIYAAGDGIVERASRYSTYGNFVRIRHNSTYKTAYGHLSRYGRGIKSGVRVRQGQIIGYTGATGQVTGPHLHYEVFVNGTRVNPVTLKLPTGKRLKGEELTAFEARRAALDQELTSLRELQRVASAAGN